MSNDALTTNEAMILQQIYEDGEDVIRSLAYELYCLWQRTIADVVMLEQKGLLDFHHGFYGLLLEVSTPGKHLIHQIWPETQPAFD